MTPDFTAWPNWPDRLECWEKTPFERECLQSIRDEADGVDEAVYWAAQAALDDEGDEGIQELKALFDEPEGYPELREPVLRIHGGIWEYET